MFFAQNLLKFKFHLDSDIPSNAGMDIFTTT